MLYHGGGGGEGRRGFPRFLEIVQEFSKRVSFFTTSYICIDCVDVTLSYP